MASIEFLNERIAKAEESIFKRTSTIERKQGTITKKIAALAKAGVEYVEGIEKRDYRDNNEAFWLICDIETLTEDIARAHKDIEEKQKALDGYKAQVTAEIEKANSRNIPAILEFLEGWKQRVTEYYHDQFPKFLKAQEEWYAIDHQHCEWHNYGGAWQMRKDNPDEYKRIEKEYKEAKAKYTSRWNFIFGYVDRAFNESTGKHDMFVFNDEKLAKELKREAEAKYDFIVERTNAIVGQITDASNLCIGDKGDLNGYIIGTKGTAKVETIGAGGYNIQCFHFRTLINKVK